MSISPAIPASNIVNVAPAVLNAGGVGLDLTGLLLCSDQHIPLGTVKEFSDLISVQTFFGINSYIAALAGTYFLADINKTQRPGALKITCYHNNQWVPAWVLSKPLPTLTPAQLQLQSFVQAGSTISMSMDGVPRNNQTPQRGITFTAANCSSLSQAAWAIGAVLDYTTNTANATTGVKGAPFNATISGNQMVVAQADNTSGITILPGDVIKNVGAVASGNAVIPPGTYILSAATTNTSALFGTFTLSHTITAPTKAPYQGYRNPCSWDATTFQFKIVTNVGANYPATFYPQITFPTGIGNLVNVLGFTAATGATINPLGNSYQPGGFPMMTVAGFMNNILTLTQDWATFCTAFDPDNGVLTSNVQKQAFAAWANLNSNNLNYMYVCWDNDPTPSTTTPASSSLGQILNTNLTSGTCPIWTPAPVAGSGQRNNGPYLAMFVMGVIAALDFTRLNGRKTLAFRSQTGMQGDIVKSGAIATNLENNFYNYYGEWTTANDLFDFLYPGTVSGPYRWVDSYVNQIWLNNAFQLALMELLTQVGSIPYNQAGYTLIKAACQDVIDAAVNYGAIRVGVTLSDQEKAEVNYMAGVQIDAVLNSVGYYLQVLDVTDTTVRANRKSPPMTFWYMDGGSVQRLNLASILVQ